MFIEKLKETFEPNKPIFKKEIISLFPNYTRAYIFRLIKKAIKEEELGYSSFGVYYLRTDTILGKSVITPDFTIQRKYVNYNDEYFGIYSGISILNYFQVTTQVPAIIQVVTNNEKTRVREIEIDNRKFVLRKSRTKITNENVHAYRVLQLFNDLSKNEQLRPYSKKVLIEYIENNKVNKKQLLELAIFFPRRVFNKLMESKILDDVA